MNTSKIFYVYQLIDPRNGKIFYVGKGSGDRLNDHERDVLRGKVTNKEKTNRMKQIHAEGFRVISHIVSVHSDEHDALDAEAELIEQLPGLTNICAKGSPSVSNIEFIKKTIEKIRSNAMIDLMSIRQEIIDIGNEYLIFADLLEKKLAEIQR